MNLIYNMDFKKISTAPVLDFFSHYSALFRANPSESKTDFKFCMIQIG